MNNKVLGIAALVGAPFLALGFLLEDAFQPLKDSWWTGAWGLLYISAWMGSMLALRRIKAGGDTWIGRNLPTIMLVTLFLADLSNVWQLFAGDYKPTFFWVLDAFWPISNLLMLVYGITVIVSGRLYGWQRFVPLFCGIWFPTAMATKVFEVDTAGFPLVIFHSALAWSLLAVVVLLNSGSRRERAKVAYSV